MLFVFEANTQQGFELREAECCRIKRAFDLHPDEGLLTSLLNDRAGVTGC